MGEKGDSSHSISHSSQSIKQSNRTPLKNNPIKQKWAIHISLPSPWGIVALSLPIMLVPKKEWGYRPHVTNRKRSFRDPHVSFDAD